jgi:hypothetical protein
MSTQGDIERLEQAIRLLKVQYDQYFAGVLNLPPFELRAEVEKLIRKYTHATFRKSSQRFYFNSLVSRFNTFSELWAKCLRLREEGRATPGYPAVMARPGLGDGNGAGMPTSEEFAGRNGGRREASPMQAVVGGPHWDTDSLRPLFQRYLEALRTNGKAAGEVSFANFARQIQRKAEAVKSRSACDAVRLRLTIDEGRVLFKARPLHRRKKTS